MKKILLVIICIIVLICFAYSLYMNSYVKYMPVILENPNDGYVDAPNLKVNINNLKIVLDFFNEKYKIIDGKLFITRKLARDKELVHNYTMKACDPEIIKQFK